MTLRTRRRIFYTLVALFILLGGGVVLYAQGWRLVFASWDTLRLEKTGGIYVRSFPENASISLNGKPISNESGFLSPGTLISDLLPKTYRVSLAAPGYDAWHENAAVLPSLVTQFKYAVLVPASGTPAASSTAHALELANASSAAEAANMIDPFDPAQKIVASTNKISIYNIAQATTTSAVKISGKNVGATWITPNIAGILQSDGELYLYDTAQNFDGGNGPQALMKLADDVKSFSATSDGSMVATLEYNSMEIFSPADSSVYYRFNLPDIADAERIIWYRDDAHLFVVYPDRVAFLDLADSSLVNFTTVAYGTKPMYDAQNNIFYITAASGKVVGYDFPN